MQTLRGGYEGLFVSGGSQLSVRAPVKPNNSIPS
jgi:hypothetical protein